MQLKDKTAIITGASSGIGKEIARHFVREGARVAIAARDLDQARAAAREIDGGGSSTLVVEMDVTDEGLVNSGVEQVCRELGGVDILVSNAGIQKVGPVDRYAFDDWKTLLAVHLDGAFLTTRACLQRMYAQGRGGSIIYIGSVHSKEGSRLKAPYVTAKHGLIGLAKVVAKEGAEHGVRTNVICPGYVRTKLVEKQIPDQARQLGISEADVVRKVMLAQTVDGEFTTLDDVARCAAFLAAFPSNALTGQSIVVSHGWYMQ
jgi:3-hydroxybutyrate dehydrogenase